MTHAINYENNINGIFFSQSDIKLRRNCVEKCCNRETKRLVCVAYIRPKVILKYKKIR